MQMVIWAFGTMVVLLLILSILPLGFTFKGKILIGFCGFILALGGQAASTSFPTLVTFLLLAALAFFAAYFMHSRFASFIYYEKEHFSTEDIYNESFPISQRNIDTNTEADLPELKEVEITPLPSKKEENIVTSLSLEKTELLDEEEEDLDVLEEDISFLQGRDRVGPIAINEESKEEPDYLSEIESLLLEDTIEPKEDSWKDELANRSFEDDIKVQEEDDFELELLFTEKEVAISKEQIEDKESENKVAVQK